MLTDGAVESAFETVTVSVAIFAFPEVSVARAATVAVSTAPPRSPAQSRTLSHLYVGLSRRHLRVLKSASK
jgi:hypothetical protein